MGFDVYGGLVAHDSLHAFCLGTGGRFRYTDNGGVTWQTVQGSIPGIDYRCGMFAVDSSGGYFVARTSDVNAQTGVYKTTDSGHTWSRVATFSEVFRSADFRDGSLSYLQFDSTILRTTDGWTSWDTVYNAAPNYDLRCIDAVSDSIVVALTFQGVLLRSVDQGGNWREYPIDDIVDNRRPIYESNIAFRDSLRGTVFVQYGEAYSTIDGGETWSHYNSRIYTPLIQIASAGSYLWILDADNVLFRGRIGVWDEYEVFWRYPITSLSHINDLFAFDDTTAIVVGDSGTILRTEDYGATWTEIPSPTSLNLTSVSFGYELEYGLACGDSGVILGTWYSGETWTVVSVGEAGVLNAVRCTRSWLAAYCVGDSGALLHTTTGNDWERLETPTSNRLLGVRSMPGQLTIFGENGTWFHSSNNGADWESEHYTDADIVGYESWNQWIDLWVSSLGEWGSGYSSLTANLRFRDLFLGQHDFFACGDSGLVAILPLVGFDAPDSPSLTPDHFSLAVYPNPFNSTATIRFDLPTNAVTRVAVYDVLGRVARDVTNQTFTAGTHTLSLDASDLASGVYFVNITTPQISTTQKLLLLR